MNEEKARSVREILRDCLEKDESNVIPLPLTYTIRALAGIIYWNACNWAGTTIDPGIVEEYASFEGTVRINGLLNGFLNSWLDKPAKPDPFEDGPCWYDFEKILEAYNNYVRSK